MRLPPEASPTSSRVDCSRCFSSSMCRFAGLNNESSPPKVMAQGYGEHAALTVGLDRPLLTCRCNGQ